MGRAIVEATTILGVAIISVALIIAGEIELAVNCICAIFTFSIITVTVEKFL